MGLSSQGREQKLAPPPVWAQELCNSRDLRRVHEGAGHRPSHPRPFAY
jgi:hypothetical protein